MFDWNILFNPKGLHQTRALMKAVREVRDAGYCRSLSESEVIACTSRLADAAEQCLDEMPSGQLTLLVALLAVEAAGLPNNFETNQGARDGKED